MGSGHSRSNITPISANHQVVTAGGASSLNCEIDDVFAATATPSGVADIVGHVLVEGEGLALYLPDEAVVVVPPTVAAQRVAGCISRGYRFLGAVVGKGLVRIWNEPRR
jgi:hypothetical protein